jgi:hypothetical protein
MVRPLSPSPPTLYERKLAFLPAEPKTSRRAPQPISPLALNAAERTFAPSLDEVAKQAYFTHLNEGSLDGREVRPWLAAETGLIAERSGPSVSGFHGRA